MDEAKQDLCKYRLEQAEQYIKTAKNNCEAGDYKSAANRSYYGIYQSIRSIIALDGVEFKKHSGNISYFRMQYIKTGVFDKSLSKIIEDSFNIRQSSDYDDFYILSKEDTVKQIENAEVFYNEIKNYIEKVLGG